MFSVIYYYLVSGSLRPPDGGAQNKKDMGICVLVIRILPRNSCSQAEHSTHGDIMFLPCVEGYAQGQKLLLNDFVHLLSIQ